MPFNQTGKRYVCKVCGTEIIVTRAGPNQKGPITCHGQPMEEKK